MDYHTRAFKLGTTGFGKYDYCQAKDAERARKRVCTVFVSTYQQDGKGNPYPLSLKDP